MIDDNTRRIQIPDGEVRELTSPDGLLWERAVSEIKGRLEAAYVTRDNGIQHLKAFGATPMKHKQDKLWSRFVPAKATDETTYPMVLTGYGKFVANGTEDYTSPTISEGKLYRNTATAGMADNSKFSYCSRTYLPATQTTRFNKSQYFTSTSGYCDFIDNDYTSVAAFKAALAANPVTILYAKATSDGSVWKFVKDIGLDGQGTDFGYFNEQTGEFVKAQGAVGTVIQPISYATLSGNNIVSTDIDALETDRVIIDANISATQSTGDMFITYATNTWIDLGSNAGTWYIRFGHTNSFSRIVSAGEIGQRNTYELYKSHFDINGVTKASLIYSAISGKWSLGAKGGGSATADYYRYTIKNDTTGEIRYDAIPVRVGQTVELLDLVSWQFAQRTGTFTAGADIQIVPEIITVNTGDLAYGVGKNLLDMATSNIKLGYYISNDGEETGDSNNFYNTKYIPVIEGETYTLSVSSPIAYASIMEYDSDKTFIKRTLFGTGTTHKITSATITLGSNTSFVLIGSNVTGVQASVLKLEEILAIDWQVELGSQATPYEPYHFGFHTDSSHKLTVGGINLFDIANTVWGKNIGGNGTEATSQYNSHTDYIECEPNTTYTVSWMSNFSLGVVTRYHEYDGNKNWLRQITTHNSSSKGEYSVTFTTGATARYICFTFRGRSESDPDLSTDIQLEEGSAASPYQPYIVPVTQDIPTLYSANSYVDIQKASNNKHEEWACIWYDGTQDVPSGYISEYGDLRANQIVLYPLATPITDQVTIAPIASARRTTYVADSESELGKLNLELKFLGK